MIYSVYKIQLDTELLLTSYKRPFGNHLHMWIWNILLLNSSFNFIFEISISISAVTFHLSSSCYVPFLPVVFKTFSSAFVIKKNKTTSTYHEQCCSGKLGLCLVAFMCIDSISHLPKKYPETVMCTSQYIELCSLVEVIFMAILLS